MKYTIGAVACVAIVAVAGASLWFTKGKGTEMAHSSESQAARHEPAGNEALATFGSGCFWCTEAVFQQMRGITRVVSGYSGGATKNPTYDDICRGDTGHAEVIQVAYDPQQVSYAELLEVFWKTHDPTTLNRQGNDVGTQYRSVIFYHDEEQRRAAERYKSELDASGAFPKPIVTEIARFTEFYPAEKHHQNYYATHAYQPYCMAVIGPKLEKFRRVFGDKVKRP